MSADILTAAIRYASDHRLPVFPVSAKRPMTTRGLLDATTDIHQIERWWTHWPNANVAIRTGRESRLVAIDIDGDEGRLSWENVQDRLADGDRITERTVMTPRGGGHVYFRHPGVPVKTRTKLLPGVDVRGDGGYVVAPPSRTPKGTYQFCGALYAMPDWLRSLVVEPPCHAGEATDPDVWVRMLRDGVAEGGRNAALTALVGHLLRRYVDVDLVAEIAHLVNQHRWRPPLGRREVDTIIDSIAALEARR